MTMHVDHDDGNGEQLVGGLAVDRDDGNGEQQVATIYVDHDDGNGEQLYYQALASGTVAVERFQDTDLASRWSTIHNPDYMQVSSAAARDGPYGLHMGEGFCYLNSNPGDGLPNYVSVDDEWDIWFNIQSTDGSGYANSVNWARDAATDTNHRVDIYVDDGRFVAYDQNDWQFDMFHPDGVLPTGQWLRLSKYSITGGYGLELFDASGTSIVSGESTAFDMSLTGEGVRLRNQITGTGSWYIDEWLRAQR